MAILPNAGEDVVVDAEEDGGESGKDDTTIREEIALHEKRISELSPTLRKRSTRVNPNSSQGQGVEEEN